MQQRPVTSKAREWLRRYLPAEILGTVMALAGALLTYHLTDSYIAAAIAGTISENIGYYGYFTAHETVRHYKNHLDHPPLRRVLSVIWKSFRDMLVEFGPAEILDSYVIRPLLLYGMPQIIPNFAAGILAGKLCADLVFYTFAIVGYELKKLWFDKPA